MGANSREFLEMRMAEIELENSSKKEIIEFGKQNALKIIDEAEQDFFKLFSQSTRLEEFAKSFNKEIRKAILDELNGSNFKAFGLEFSTKNGASRPNYKEDEMWSEIKELLKEREALLKLALKSKSKIYDADGVEVPRVSVSCSGEVLNVKY